MSAHKPQEVGKKYLQDRPKTFIEKVISFFMSDGVVKLYILPIIALLVLPGAALPLAMFIGMFVYFRVSSDPEMPFFIPQSSGIKVDRFNPKPNKNKDGSKNYRGAEGIAYLGNVEGTNEQAWFDNSTLRQHVAFLAATGSGKTYTITGIACVNALLWGSGYTFTDAKADLAIIVMHLSILWRLNRVDDFFCLNYINGSINPWDDYNGHRTTNTYNMLESGSSSMATETFKSLMAGDGDIWAKRADSLVAAILRPLVYMRDANYINLSMSTMLEYLTVEACGGLIGDQRIPDSVKSQIFGFIKTLPGMSAPLFEEIKKGQPVKSTQIYDQFGFASMQIILVVNMLAGDYSKIFDVMVGEIDLEAIVLQDRVMVALLPALEASSASVASMGRIILAARKGMMGRSLGERIEGSVKANIEQRPTNTNYPFINITDECGMIFAEGEGAVSAQARGLGYSQWYSAQDLPAMGKLSEAVAKEVKTVMGNTIIKIAGRIIDQETYDLYKGITGEAYVWQRDRSSLSISSGGGQNSSEDSASYTKIERLDQRELQELNEGEIFITARDRLHRINGPDLHTKPLKVMQLNEFVTMIPHSNEKILEARSDSIFLKADYLSVIEGKTSNSKPIIPSVELQRLSEMLSDSLHVTGNIERSSFLSLSCVARCYFEELESISNNQSHSVKMAELRHAEQEKEQQNKSSEPEKESNEEQNQSESNDEKLKDEVQPSYSVNDTTTTSTTTTSTTTSTTTTSNSDTNESNDYKVVSTDDVDTQPEVSATGTESILSSMVDSAFKDLGLTTESVRERLADINEIDINDGTTNNREVAIEMAIDSIESMSLSADYPIKPTPSSDTARLKSLLTTAYHEITGENL